MAFFYLYLLNSGIHVLKPINSSPLEHDLDLIPHHLAFNWYILNSLLQYFGIYTAYQSLKIGISSWSICKTYIKPIGRMDYMNLKLSLIVSVLAISLFTVGCSKKEEQATPADVKSTHMDTDTSQQHDPSADLAAVSKANLGEEATSSPASLNNDQHNATPPVAEETTPDPMAEINATSNKIISDSEKSK